MTKINSLFFKNDQIYMKDAQFVEINKKSIFWCLVFHIWSISYWNFKEKKLFLCGSLFHKPPMIKKYFDKIVCVNYFLYPPTLKIFTSTPKSFASTGKTLHPLQKNFASTPKTLHPLQKLCIHFKNFAFRNFHLSSRRNAPQLSFVCSAQHLENLQQFRKETFSHFTAQKKTSHFLHT